MTETFNVFDDPSSEPVNRPDLWRGADICTITEPHYSHNWTIDFVYYGSVSYGCPGVGVRGSVPVEPTSESDISDDRDA